ncbi:MAG: NAD(P)H-hydrate dehydratase [Puniceicoccaceae bacterium]
MTQLYPILSIEAAQAYESSVLGNDATKTAAAMENAGRAIGEALLKDFTEITAWPESPKVLILGGKGLNTGDAIVACGVLNRVHPRMQAVLVQTVPSSEYSPIAAAALETLQGSMGERLQLVTSEAFLEQAEAPFDVVIDGLYGHGFRPPLGEAASTLLQAINARTSIALRVAVDLPSGLGEAVDENAFISDITYVPGVAKAPCFDKANATYVGRIRFLEIDPFLEQEATSGQTEFVGSPRAYKALNKVRPAQTDKRDYGHCLILAGSSQMPGAALMATLGSLHAGAGLVTTLAPATVATQIASRVPEAMWRPLPMTPEGGLDVETVRIVAHAATKAQAMLIGPGLVLDRATVFTLCRVVRETHIPLVLDASALTQDIVAAVLGRPLSAGPVIITPHVGEFARMHGIKDISNPIQELIRFSHKYRTVTVLKGSPTYISDGNKLIAMPVGGPVLARGGAGDILSGMLASLLAQDPDNPLDVALQAASWHGAAGDVLARERGAVAVHTTEMLPFLSDSLRARD